MHSVGFYNFLHPGGKIDKLAENKFKKKIHIKKLEYTSLSGLRQNTTDCAMSLRFPFPRAEDLNPEELDYELTIREQSKDVFDLDTQGKQRQLRVLFKSDQQRCKNWPSNLNIIDEIDHIEGRINNLEGALERKIEPRLESRVLHYWFRTKRCIANNELEKRLRRDMIRRIEKIMKNYQFGPPLSPIKEQIRNIIHDTEETEEGGALNPVEHKTPERRIDVEASTPRNGVERIPELEFPNTECDDYRKSPSRYEGATSYDFLKNLDEQVIKTDWNTGYKWTELSKQGSKGTGAIPKTPKYSSSSTERQGTKKRMNTDSTVVVSRKEWEDMKRTITSLTEKLSDVEKDRNKTRLDEYQNQLNRPSKTQQRDRTGNKHRGEGRKEQETKSSLREKDSDSDSTDEGSNRAYHSEEDDTTSSSSNGQSYRYSAGNRNYDGRRGHGHYDRDKNYRRVEKWKIRFSGDPKAISVESFLYKIKKLAEREEVSNRILLRDVHLLLDGAAADWFFTFVDEFDRWKTFEELITYRFGNPNKDQGIRSKIRNRYQQKGEPFIAFVTEIEKLNRMLTRPLSQRRKFEVIWDNMRQHYRSKISIVEVKDLKHLTSLNYRIDAADPSLQYQTERPADATVRKTINHLEVDNSEDDSDCEGTSVNAIKGRPSNFRTSNTSANNSQRVSSTDHPKSSQQQSNSALQQQNNTTQSQGNTPTTSPNIRTAEALRTTQLLCWNCQEQGHGWRQCTKSRAIFCYGCGSLGRTIRNCESCINTSQRSANARQGNC